MRICIYSFILVLVSNLFAADFYIKLGSNWSELPSEDSESVPGLCAGFGITHWGTTSNGVFSSVELLYIRKNILLRQRTWPGGLEPEISDVEVGDIPIDISYLELPCKIGYNFGLNNADCSLNLFAGGSFSIALAYHSKIQSHTIFLPPEEKGKFDFDYLRCSQNTQILAFNYLGGVAFAFKKVRFEIAYSFGVTELKCLRGLTISDQINSVQAALVYCF